MLAMSLLDEELSASEELYSMEVIISLVIYQESRIDLSKRESSLLS